MRSLMSERHCSQYSAPSPSSRRRAPARPASPQRPLMSSRSAISAVTHSSHRRSSQRRSSALVSPSRRECCRPRSPTTLSQNRTLDVDMIGIFRAPLEFSLRLFDRVMPFLRVTGEAFSGVSVNSVVSVGSTYAYTAGGGLQVRLLRLEEPGTELFCARRVTTVSVAPSSSCACSKPSSRIRPRQWRLRSTATCARSPSPTPRRANGTLQALAAQKIPKNFSVQGALGDAYNWSSIAFSTPTPAKKSRSTTGAWIQARARLPGERVAVDPGRRHCRALALERGSNTAHSGRGRPALLHTSWASVTQHRSPAVPGRPHARAHLRPRPRGAHRLLNRDFRSGTFHEHQLRGLGLEFTWW